MILSTHKQALQSCTTQHKSCTQLAGRRTARHPRPFSSSNPMEVGRQGLQLPRRDSPSPCSAGFGGFGFGKKKADAKPNGANNSKKCPCDLGEEYVVRCCTPSCDAQMMSRSWSRRCTHVVSCIVLAGKVLSTHTLDHVTGMTSRLPLASTSMLCTC
jgi:hypothetical protein